ncbi:hypothetical protein [Dyella mobilis]|uniref:Uncharacterized protein n=1 Tax=Dyella mobilis TaxID=1849582 RepID=A0ABS2KC71_9GAMM|nr:hypothetical protein [Dyella mobilis]MBM7128790.1 hypothetical protein [Dyella mobilis]GLQ99121.1 hypothetical protein GCM10007863_35410 [Dyella mobilis]
MSIILPVDFGNSDADGAVRLGTKQTLEAIDGNSIELSRGMRVTITDDEVTAEGTTELRDGFWVVLITRWLP